MTSLRQSFGSGLRWASVSQVGRQVMLLGTLILLSRLITPSDFGVLSMATTVTGFIDLFKDLGAAAAIVQRRELSQRLLSSIFWVNMGFSALSMLGLLILAPVVALLYNEPGVTQPLRILSVAFLLSGAGIVQQAMLQRAMAFKAIAQIELAATCAGVVVALAVAFAGGGIWSLIAQTIVSAATITSLSWLVGRWQPAWVLDRAALTTIQNYSLNLVGFNIVNYFMRNADYILIGRFLGSTSLGYYTLAYRIMLYPIQNLSAVIGRVLFPALARLNDDPARFRRIYLQVAGALAVIAFPLFTGLTLLSDLVIAAAFGPSWQPAAALLAVLAPVGLIQVISHTAGTIYQVSGRTNLLLRWGLISGLITLTGFLVGLHWGVMGVASAYTLVTVALIYPVFAIPLRLIGLPVAALAATMLRPALCSLCLLAVVLAVRQVLPVSFPLFVQLALLATCGALSYGLASWLINRAQLVGLAAIIRPNRLQQPL